MSAVPQSGEPRTIVVPGTGSNSLTFTIPPGITLSVESVLAQVDASGAGGPVTATLSVLEQSGVVIANKRQGEAVDAGGPGSATWALRLADEQATPSTALGPFEQFLQAVPTTINPFAATSLPWVHSSDAFLLGLSTPTDPVAINAGTYTFNMLIVPQFAAVAPYEIFWRFQTGLGGIFSGLTGSGTWVQPQPFNYGVNVTITRTYAAGDKFRLDVTHNAVAAKNFLLLGTVQQLA